MGHPEAAETNLEKVAIRTVALEWRGNDLYGKSEVLKGTPCGDIAATLLKKSKLGISSRGLGQVDEDGYVNNESYKLLCWDLVSNSSNYPSWVKGVYEGKTFAIETPQTDEELLEELNKQRERHFKKVSGMFGTMLKETTKEHKCTQCNKDMGNEWLLGPVCGKCVRENHKKATGRK